MPSLRFSQAGHNLNRFLDINFAQIFISLIVLLFSLTIHETAHAWTADRLGDPNGRLVGRISPNPLMRVAPLGTFLLPMIAACSGGPLSGWAQPAAGKLPHPP